MAGAKILDGKWLSKVVQAEIKDKVSEVVPRFGRPPGLAVLVVGDNPASQAYVASKEKVADLCGFQTFDRRFPANIGYDAVRKAILEFNQDERVDGILLQLPLPVHLPTNQLLDDISPGKDADCLHPINQGLFLRGEGRVRPCTPLGVMRLVDLAYSSVVPGSESAQLADIPHMNLSGKTAIVIGRSILVGKPTALMLLERNATVFMAHSKTRDLPGLAQTADIIVAAVGVPNLVKANCVRQGAIVIDVGINRLPNGKLAGDTDYQAILPRCYAITPVPGGVGPMTVAMLMYNTLKIYLGKVG